MQSVFFEQEGGRIHALQFGEGPELLIAIHGFSDRARMFAVLEEALAPCYKVVAIDLPFHGQTEWERDTFYKEDLIALIRQILAAHGKERFSIMAFSFGARLTQAMLPEFIHQLDKLYLLSPDGVKTQGMTMATRTPMWMRTTLHRILRRPGWFLGLVNAGRKVRLVPKLIHHFLTNNINRPERYRRTFGCWMALDSFYLGRREIKKILSESGLPTEVYIGARDPMLGQAALRKVFGDLPNVHLHVLDEGHRLVGEKLRDELKAC